MVSSWSQSRGPWALTVGNQQCCSSICPAVQGRTWSCNDNPRKGVKTSSKSTPNLLLWSHRQLYTLSNKPFQGFVAVHYMYGSRKFGSSLRLCNSELPRYDLSDCSYCFGLRVRSWSQSFLHGPETNVNATDFFKKELEFPVRTCSFM